jgi:hypothetical protein
VSLTDPGSVGLYGESQEQLEAEAARLGLRLECWKAGRYRVQWSCEDDVLPGYTERNKSLERAMFTPAAYKIYSAALHAEWHAVIGGWCEVTMDDGSRTLFIRPDRVAVWGAVLVAAAPAVVPATRALILLGHRARQREIYEWTGGVLGLMRDMGLPREWWI